MEQRQSVAASGGESAAASGETRGPSPSDGAARGRGTAGEARDAGWAGQRFTSKLSAGKEAGRAAWWRGGAGGVVERQGCYWAWVRLGQVCSTG